MNEGPDNSSECFSCPGTNAVEMVLSVLRKLVSSPGVWTWMPAKTFPHTKWQPELQMEQGLQSWQTV